MRQLSQLCRALSQTVKDAIPDVKDAIGDGHRHLVNNDFFVAILYVGDVPDTSMTRAKAPVMLCSYVCDILLYLLSCHYIKCLGRFGISHVCLKMSDTFPDYREHSYTCRGHSHMAMSFCLRMHSCISPL